jgi:hypothetical protein
VNLAACLCAKEFAAPIAALAPLYANLTAVTGAIANAASGKLLTNDEINPFPPSLSPVSGFLTP